MSFGELVSPPRNDSTSSNTIPTAEPKPRMAFSNPPTSAVNLIGSLERWGIGPTTRIAAVSIRIATATGAQLEDLFRQLPDNMALQLSLEKEDC